MSKGDWTVRRRLLQQAFAREKGVCFWCEGSVNWRARRYLSINHELARYHMAATLDHIIPVSIGGQDEIGNVVCACYGCNTKRLDMPAEKFLEKTKQ